MKDNNQENILRSLEEALVSRKALLDNYNNLNKVADYCENVYSNVSLLFLSLDDLGESFETYVFSHERNSTLFSRCVICPAQCNVSSR